MRGGGRMTCVEPACQSACSIAVGCLYITGEPILRVVGDRHRIVLVVERDQREYLGGGAFGRGEGGGVYTRGR